MQVLELMSQPVITCRPDDTLNRVAQLMWEHDCGAIPVTGDDGKLVGIITDRDVCMAAYMQGAPLQAIRVTTVMAREVFSCQPQDSIGDAERLMADKQIRRVPVLDGAGRPVGLLSLNDIARENGSGARQAGFDRQLAQTLSAVCQPRRCSMTLRRFKGWAERTATA